MSSMSAVNVQITAGRLEKYFSFFRHFHSSVVTVVFASSAKKKACLTPPDFNRQSVNLTKRQMKTVKKM